MATRASVRRWAVVLAWERRYNLERFSMALAGRTPAEKLAASRIASAPSGDVPGVALQARPRAGRSD